MALIFVTCLAVLVDDSPMGKVRANRLSEIMQQNRHAFPEVPEMDLPTLLERLKEKDVILVDARSAKERAVSMIPGAISIDDFEASLPLEPGKTVVCYCTVGYRSAACAKRLMRDGIDARNFNGSIVLWCQNNQPLKTPTGKETRRVHTYGRKWNLVPDSYEATW